MISIVVKKNILYYKKENKMKRDLFEFKNGTLIDVNEIAMITPVYKEQPEFLWYLSFKIIHKNNSVPTKISIHSDKEEHELERWRDDWINLRKKWKGEEVKITNLV